MLTDIRMPPTGTDEGIQVARALRAAHPEIGVVVLSQFAEPSYVLDAARRRARAGRAYLLKERVQRPRELDRGDRGGGRGRIGDRSQGGRGARPGAQRSARTRRWPS